MTTFKSYVGAGVVSTAVALGLGYLALQLADLGGVWTFVGWIAALLCFAVAGLFLLQVMRVWNYQRKGRKLARENPERFEELRQEYHDAVEGLDDEEATSHDEGGPA